MKTPTKPNLKPTPPALTGFIFVALASSAIAADFPGTLKGVTITDAQTTNQPPVASFTYAIEGSTATFDASSSHDSDGTITKYKWDFGNNVTAEGASATATLTEGTSLNVTLTVVDNTNGVALSQQTVPPPFGGIFDDFSADTATNYKSFGTNSLAITGGHAVQNGIWTGRGIYYHTTSLESADQTVQAKIGNLAEKSSSSGVLVRANGTTGYTISPNVSTNDKLIISTVNGQSTSYVSGMSYTGGRTWTTGTYHLIEVTIRGSSLSVKIDWNDDGDFSGLNEADMTSVTNSAIASGNYAGFTFYNNGLQTQIENFKAKSL